MKASIGSAGVLLCALTLMGCGSGLDRVDPGEWVSFSLDGALISSLTLTSTVDAFRFDAAHWVPATCAE